MKFPKGSWERSARVLAGRGKRSSGTDGLREIPVCGKVKMAWQIDSRGGCCGWGLRAGETREIGVWKGREFAYIHAEREGKI